MATKNLELFARADKVAPGAIHSNIRYFAPSPLFLSRAKGSKLWDVDGNEYIDCVVNMGAIILGHGHPKVTQAVKDQIENGLTCGAESELSVEVAERLTRMIPCAETVKFSNTGTEAVMKAIMIARAFTGRDMIIKMEGGYNGWYDCVLTSVSPSFDRAGPEQSPNSVPENAGLLRAAAEKTLVVPFNNVDVAEKIVRGNRDKVAALLVEPVQFNLGCVLPKEGYLKALRDMTEENGVLLIFDEVISGFRVAPGGAQEYYGVTPDMATFAKAIANGFPLSAVAARADIMETSRPGGKAGYGGLYNGSQASLAAASAALSLLSTGEVQKGLDGQTQRLVKAFGELARDLGVGVRMQGFAGQFQVYFTDREITDYRSSAMVDAKKYGVFQRSIMKQKIYSLPPTSFHHGISSAHTDEDIANITSAMENALKDVKAST
jgi:glutamate-1-semialdehyde 2,1-aminomutase